MNAFNFLLAVWAGAMVPLQAAVNARLARAVGGPIWAASISALIVALVLAVVAATSAKSAPRLDAVSTVPWWAWSGGFCGAVVLSGTTVVAPRIGAASMVALVMTGQVLAAMVIDGAGWFGMAAQPIGLQRILAATCLILGAALMNISFKDSLI